MTPEDIARLDDPDIQAALDQNTLPVDRATMAWRKHHPDWPVAAMADQLLIRQRASQN